MSIRLVKVSHKAQAQDRSEAERFVAELKKLLVESFRLRHAGVAHAKQVYAQAYADGYMKMMLDSGMVSSQELLGIVADARRGVDGPATAVVHAAPVLETNVSLPQAAIA